MSPRFYKTAAKLGSPHFLEVLRTRKIAWTVESAWSLFNVLNARGMPLSNADLVKNSLFSQLNGKISESEKLEETGNISPLQ